VQGWTHGRRSGGVRARRRRCPRRGRGRHAAGPVPCRVPAGRGGRHVDRRGQRRPGRVRPVRAGHRAPGPPLDVAGGRGRVRRLHRPSDAPVRGPHPPALAAPAAPPAGERAGGVGHVHRPEGAVPLLRGEHRAGRRALVRQWTAGRRGARVLGRAGSAAADGDRWRTLCGRWHRELDPDRRGGPDRGETDLRVAGRAGGAAARRAQAAVGGGAGGVRDRPPAPVRARDGLAARRRACACASERRWRRGPGRFAVGVPGHGRGGPPDQPGVHGLRSGSGAW
jgi:hypothetical protein